MASAFNPQILMEKLAKLNSTQQSIETLSHWCIFHMNKAKYVVEIWSRQFHCSPRDRRLTFLYLANDILQNSRRKGAEFVGEFWKVLPDALRDVIESGDEHEMHAARRLIIIWEDRKVFGSRGQLLKEEFVGREPENINKNGKQSLFKLKQCNGNSLEKVVSDYQLLCGAELDEDVIMDKCRNAISSVEKISNANNGDNISEQVNGQGYLEELQGQHAKLRDCVEQLLSIEASRSRLVTNLREAMQEQEFKLGQVRNQLQAAQSLSEQAQQLTKPNNVQPISNQNSKESLVAQQPQPLKPQEEQLAPVVSRQASPSEQESAAADAAAKLTTSTSSTSTSSAQMLTYVLNTLATDGVITNNSSGDYPSAKKPKLENDLNRCIPLQNPQPPSQQLNVNQQPPPPSSPPPIPPLPPMQPYPLPPQFMQTAGVPFSYGMARPPLPPPMAMPGYPFAVPPTNHHNFQNSDGVFYTQSSSLPMAPQ